MQPTRFAAFLLLSTLAAGASGRAQAPASLELPADRAAGASTIDIEELRGWLTYLTSPELRGRATGQPGYELAANFVREHFREVGLEPAFGEDYFQAVPWLRQQVDTSKSSFELARGGESVATLRSGDGVKISATSDADVRGPVAAVWFGGDADGLEKLELKGHEVILVADAHPVRGLLGYYEAARAIRRAGGSLALLVDDRLHADYSPQPTTSPGSVGGNRAAGRRGTMPRVMIATTERARDVLATAQLAWPTDAAPISRDPDVTAATTVVIQSETAPAFNVVGILRGSDPKLRDEFVVIGCHLDHLGEVRPVGQAGEGLDYAPGADDDGSGSVGVMALARAFAENPVRPRRSILFVAFCGEERGLLGSLHFAQHPPIALEQIVAELQLDMIGRNEEKQGETAADNLNCLHLIGTGKLSSDLHDLCVHLNEERAKFALEWDEEDVFYRSDHWNFAREGVPVAFFFTGFHPDYHRPTDTIEKIDFEKLRRIATYVYDIAFELAQADDRPQVDATKWESLQRKARKDPAAPLRK